MWLLLPRRLCLAAALLLVLLSTDMMTHVIEACRWQASQHGLLVLPLGRYEYEDLLVSLSRLLPSSCDPKACHCQPTHFNNSSELGCGTGALLAGASLAVMH
jgi:hypothetical protein